MSPTVFRERGLRFYFFSREEPRPHVHVQGQGGEAKFWLEPQIDSRQTSVSAQLGCHWPFDWPGSMSRKSVKRGRSTSGAEVTNIAKAGFWLLVDDREMFVSFKHFPWFRQATIGQVLNVELPSPDHLYWPDLDVDLAVESIAHPKRFPLISKVRPNNTLHPTAGVRSSAGVTPARAHG